MNAAAMETRTILLTGAGGFIGRSLLARLGACGANVHSLVRSRPADSFEHQVQGEGEAAIASIRDVLDQISPDVVVHLASAFRASHTPGDIETLIDSNIRLGMRLLEAMEQSGFRRLINTGTYWQHFENRSYDPVNLYAATKQAFEDIIDYYVNAKSFCCVTLQLYDTYGPGDTRPKILALLEKTAREGAHLGLSPGEQLIDLVHVDDVCSAYEAAILRTLRGDVHGHERYCVSSGAPRRLRDVVSLFEHVSGKKLSIGWGERPYRPREVMKPYDAGIPVPEWAPLVDLEDGLRQLLAGTI